MVFAKLFSEAQKKRKAGAKKPPVEKERPSKKKRSPPQETQAQDPTAEQHQRDKRRRGHSGGNGVPHCARQNNHHNPSKMERVPPSAEALEFSQKLKELSRQKRLDEAVQLYWDRVPSGMSDQHHACIVIDCAARCGDVEAAERIVEHLRRQRGGEPLSVETQTALLKGYAHAGRIAEAMDLFRGMKRFNVRTLNTLLRGCLWTAVTTRDDPVTGSATLVGGVVSSEEAWRLYQAAWPGAASTLDVSSYEYSISLLCQALRTKEAEERIGSFQTAYSIRVKGTAKFAGGEQASLETLAVAYLGLSRAHALLGQSDEMWRSSQRALCAIKLSRASLMENKDCTNGAVVAASEADSDHPKKKKQKGASGGKRGWKASRETEEVTAPSSLRESSNVAFRTHRLSELESEVRSLLKTRGKKTKKRVSREAMTTLLQTRLLYFSGGGSTELSAVQGKKTKSIQSDSRRSSHLASAWFSFGLSRFAKGEVDKTVVLPTHDVDSAWIAERCGLSKAASAVDEDGTIEFENVFGNHKRPLDIEIGAGFGTWICQQAQENKYRNYVAVELRADRVSNIFARVMLDSSEPLDNVCVVGAECGSVFRDRIKKESVSCIFANYPEPPTQTHGGGRSDLRSIASGAGKEPAHMLNSTSIIEMSRSLKADGKIIVVSDNRFYARLLAATFARVVNQDKKLIRSVRPNELKDSSLQHAESFSNEVDLYEGRPERAIGHAKNSSSYFDRLWRTGAGSHSERRTRFVILMKRS